MKGTNVEHAMEILQAISNGVTAQAYSHQISELMLWMLVKEEAERHIKRLDTDYT